MALAAATGDESARWRGSVGSLRQELWQKRSAGLGYHQTSSKIRTPKRRPGFGFAARTTVAGIHRHRLSNRGRVPRRWSSRWTTFALEGISGRARKLGLFPPPECAVGARAVWPWLVEELRSVALY